MSFQVLQLNYHLTNDYISKNYSKTCKTSVSCQKSLVLIDSDSTAIYVYSLSTIGATTMLTIDSTDVISQSDNTDGLQSTVSKWSASNTTPTNPTPPSTTVGCASLQTPAKVSIVFIKTVLYDGLILS